MIGRKYGDPFARLEENISKNPLGGDRQRRDLQELHKFNRNPRLNKFTSIQFPRSQTFLPPRNEAKALRQALVKLKVKAFKQIKDINSSDHIKQIEKNESEHSCIDDKETKITYVIPRNIYMTKFPYRSSPPTFGHRPGSASRILYPKTLIDHQIDKFDKKDIQNKANTVAARNQLSNANVCIGMSSKLLHHLLHKQLKPHHENLQKKKHIAVELEESNKNDYCCKEKALSQQTKNIQLSGLDDSFYKVWGTNERFSWDKTSFMNSLKGQYSIISRYQIERKPNSRLTKSKEREKIDRRKAPDDFAPPPWKIELNQKLSTRRKQRISRQSNASKQYIDSLVQLNYERRKILDQRVQRHMRAMELERIEKIKDKKTMTSHWERIFHCR